MPGMFLPQGLCTGCCTVFTCFCPTPARPTPSPLTSRRGPHRHLGSVACSVACLALTTTSLLFLLCSCVFLTTGEPPGGQSSVAVVSQCLEQCLVYSRRKEEQGMSERLRPPRQAAMTATHPQAPPQLGSGHPVTSGQGTRAHVCTQLTYAEQSIPGPCLTGGRCQEPDRQERPCLCPRPHSLWPVPACWAVPSTPCLCRTPADAPPAAFSTGGKPRLRKVT